MKKNLLKLSSLRRRLLLLPLFTLALCAVSVIYSYMSVFSLPETFNVTSCYIRTQTGFICPGCGGSRALAMLLCIRPVFSFLLNPLPLTGAVLLLYANILAAVSYAKDDPKYIRRFDLRLIIIIPVLLILYCLIRNIVFFTQGVDPIKYVIDLFCK